MIDKIKFAEGPLPSEVHSMFRVGEALPRFEQAYGSEFEHAYKANGLNWVGGFACSQEIMLGCALSLLKIMGYEPKGKVLSPYIEQGLVMYGVGLWTPPKDYPVKGWGI